MSPFGGLEICSVSYILENVYIAGETYGYHCNLKGLKLTTGLI